MGLSFLLRMLICSCFTLLYFSGVQALATPISVFEEQLEKSTSNKRILLVIDGDSITKFRLADLEKIPLYEIEMPPIWKEEGGKYQGVLLKDILSSAGVSEATSVRLVALDGYLIELPEKKWHGGCAFVATRYKKQEIPVEDKGPTRLMFPCMVTDPDYEETTTSEWIWNLREIHI